MTYNIFKRNEIYKELIETANPRTSCYIEVDHNILPSVSSFYMRLCYETLSKNWIYITTFCRISFAWNFDRCYFNTPLLSCHFNMFPSKRIVMLQLRICNEGSIRESYFLPLIILYSIIQRFYQGPKQSENQNHSFS